MKTINNYIFEKILISKNTKLLNHNYIDFDDFISKHGFTYNQDDSSLNVKFYDGTKDTCLKYYNKIKDHYNNINDIHNHPSVYEKDIDLDEEYIITCTLEKNLVSVRFVSYNTYHRLCNISIFIDDSCELAYWKSKSIINDKELVKYLDEKMILLLEKIFDT